MSGKMKGSNELGIGDHIYSYRFFHFYSHHGIYVGGGRVIHYTNTDSKPPTSVSASRKRKKPICKECGFDPERQRGVIKTCLDCFRNGHTVRVFKYGVSPDCFILGKWGTSSTGPCDEPTVVLQRAEAMLTGEGGGKVRGFGEYDLETNNCECFAFYCKTGKRLSMQTYYAESPYQFENLMKNLN